MVVVDASVAYKWFAPDELYSQEALRFWDMHVQKKNIITAPNLLIYELANAWSTKTGVLLKDIKENLETLRKAKFELVDVTIDLINKAVAFSKKYKISVYDASYIALAQDKKCNLVTADDKLLKKVNLPFVKSLAD